MFRYGIGTGRVADAAATHQSVIHVMEASRAAGYVHVTFATQASPSK